MKSIRAILAQAFQRATVVIGMPHLSYLPKGFRGQLLRGMLGSLSLPPGPVPKPAAPSGRAILTGAGQAPKELSEARRDVTEG
jgi:hypothetical protein